MTKRRSRAEVEAEYERFKRFVIAFAEYLDARIGTEPRPTQVGRPGPDGEVVHEHVMMPPLRFAPLVADSIEKAERERFTGWRGGMREAVQDNLEHSRDWPPEEVRSLDALLAGRGAPTLTELRREIWQTIPRVVARGRIRTSAEYHLLVERLNDQADQGLSAEDRSRVSGMVAEYEQRRGKR